MEINSFFIENWREIIAKNILYERERLNLNQRQLSEQMGKKDPTTISKWENAEGTFNLDVLVSLCKLFGRTPNQMLCEDLSLKSPPDDDKPKAAIKEMGAKGASTASESPPKADNKEDIKLLRQTALEILNKIELMNA